MRVVSIRQLSNCKRGYRAQAKIEGSLMEFIRRLARAAELALPGAAAEIEPTSSNLARTDRSLTYLLAGLNLLVMWRLTLSADRRLQPRLA